MNLQKPLFKLIAKNQSIAIFLAALWLMCTPLEATDVLVEAKGSYFGFTDSYFRKVYGNGAGLYGVEFSARSWKNLFPWASISFLSKEGHFEKSLHSTHLIFVPLGIGLKYLFPVKMLDFYVGAGALATFVQTRRNFSTVGQIGGGGLAKLGILFHHRKKLFLDLFTDYSWQFVPNMQLRGRKLTSGNLNGWSTGLGIGYKF